MSKSHRNAKATSNESKLKRSLFAASLLFVWDIALYAVYVWANWVNFTDESGWSGLLTIPVLLVAFAMLITTAVGFIVLAARAPKKGGYRAYLLLGVIISLLPLISTVSYALVSNGLEQAARQRAETPIVLQEAKQLITACQVETISRHNGGKLQLNANVPVLPGEETHSEYRRFDVMYYDELRALTRGSEVQSRCGFVPSYDIERPTKPVVNSWITKEEAAAIIEKCIESTRLNSDAEYPKLELPQSNPTGILLSLRLNVWNDEKDSNIYLIGADDQARTFLQTKERSCLYR